VADLNQLISRSQTDEAFRKGLVSNPRPVLEQYGLKFPASVDIKVVESNDKTFYLSLPPAMSEELSDEQLEAVGGGDACCCCSCASSCS
jgi:hypothetical protein